MTFSWIYSTSEDVHAMTTAQHHRMGAETSLLSSDQS